MKEYSGIRLPWGAKEEIIGRIVSWLACFHGGKSLVCANPHSLVLARSDWVFREAIRNADMIVPDGVGIVMVSRMLGGKIRDRVTGSDIFWGLSDRLNSIGDKSYFFLGSTQATLARIVDRMSHDFPGIRVAGTFSPPFKAGFTERENAEMVEAVNRAAADVLWVGMTAPKQEKWIYSNRSRLDVKFIGAIGAAFDFYSGNMVRSNSWFIEHGLEWLARLLCEPRRMWTRSLVSAPLFLGLNLQETIARRHRAASRK